MGTAHVAPSTIREVPRLMTASWQDTLIAGAIVAGILIAVLALHWLITRALVRLPARRARAAAEIVSSYAEHPSRWLLGSATLAIGLPLLQLEPDVQRPIRHGLVLVIIAAVGWLLVRLVGAGAELLSRRLNLENPDNLRARRAQTQAMITRRISAVIIITVTAAVMLTTFPQVRTLGASLLASAGIAGLVLGFAAQQTLANLIAGIQIALAEPIRLDDVVVVEGEWGRIEEITFTYVVVRSWDQRRLVLPISYFTQTPFENWTRQRADLVGAVSLHVDYSAPLGELREELERAVNESPLWDGRTVGLQAVDAHERTVELRALVSGRSSGDVWDLRCVVRERLVEYLQRHHPGALPRVRTEVTAADGGGVRLASDTGAP